MNYAFKHTNIIVKWPRACMHINTNIRLNANKCTLEHRWPDALSWDLAMAEQTYPELLHEQYRLHMHVCMCACSHVNM